MSGYVVKPVGEDFVHRAQFNAPLLRTGEFIVDDYGWRVKLVSAEGPRLRVVHQSIGLDFATATLTGGMPGEVYMLTSEVGTNQDRHLRRSYVLRLGA